MRQLLSAFAERGREVRALRVAANFARIVPGWLTYLATGQTPPSAYGAMRQLFCHTDGRFNDTVSSLLKVVRRPYRLENQKGVLGDMEDAGLRTVIDALDRDGYFVFGHRLSDDHCREIEDFALRTPCYPRMGDGRTSVLFQRGNTADAVFDFRADDLMRCPALVDLIGDPSLLAIAQEYLGSRVVMDLVTMWWSTPGTGRPSSEGAQLYHFDMDRLKFLKVFFLITDVDEETGPHCYVRGSHHRKPRALLTDGRKSDEEIEGHYADRIVRIFGPRGTMFVADTRGFHKGEPLRRGSRLMFQIEFANSLFGQNYPSIATDRSNDRLRAMADLYPFTYSNFTFSEQR